MDSYQEHQFLKSRSEWGSEAPLHVGRFAGPLSTVLFIGFVTICFAVLGLDWHPTVAKIIWIVWFTIANAFLVLLLTQTNKISWMRCKQISVSQMQEGVHHKQTTILKITGLYIFGTASLVKRNIDSFEMVWLYNFENSGYLEILLYLSGTAFVILELRYLFAVTTRSYAYLNNSYLRFVFVTILCFHFTSYFWLCDAFILFRQKETPAIKKIMAPFHNEYHIIACGFFIDLWRKMEGTPLLFQGNVRRRNSAPTLHNKGEINISGTSGDLSINIMDPMNTNPPIANKEETTHVVHVPSVINSDQQNQKIDIYSAEEYSNNNSVEERTTLNLTKRFCIWLTNRNHTLQTWLGNRHHSLQTSTIIPIYVLVLSSIVYLVLAIIIGDNTMSTTAEITIIIIEFFLSFICILVCFWLVHPCKTYNKQKPISKDTLLLVTSTGYFIFEAIRIFRSLLCLYNEDSDGCGNGFFFNILTCTQAILKVLIIYLQTPLLTHLKHYCLLAYSREKPLKYALFFLLIFNITYWIKMSFVESIWVIEKALQSREGWVIFVHLVYPFCLLYGFQSATIIIGICVSIP